MNTRLKDRGFLAGRYSIADMACVGWIRFPNGQQEKDGGEAFADFRTQALAHRGAARPAVQRGIARPRRGGEQVDVSDPTVRACCSASARSEGKHSTPPRPPDCCYRGQQAGLAGRLHRSRKPIGGVFALTICFSKTRLVEISLAIHRDY